MQFGYSARLFFFLSLLSHMKLLQSHRSAGARAHCAEAAGTSLIRRRRGRGRGGGRRRNLLPNRKEMVLSITYK